MRLCFIIGAALADLPELKSSESRRPSSSATSGVDVKRPEQKVLDLSDLPTAARKRRALAGCKKADVRKFAKAGSESKCSEKVSQTLKQLIFLSKFRKKSNRFYD